MENREKRIFIIGPIGNFGGREVEVNTIARSLEKKHKVTILSTAYITKKSFALQNLDSTKFSSLGKLIFKKFVLIRLSSYISFFKNGMKKSIYGYSNNTWSKKFLQFEKRTKNVLFKNLEGADLVILAMQLTSQFFSEIIEFCDQRKIPVIVRTTGTIKVIPSIIHHVLNRVTLFLHHSPGNAHGLNSYRDLPYTIIDQCVVNEEELLKLPVTTQYPLRFGFIGRFTEEKNILFLLDSFSKVNQELIIAGEGNLETLVNEKIKSMRNCKNEGIVDHPSIADFYNQIDVLIIASSHESGPLVGLEAMAAGKIILSTKVGAMVDRLKATSNQFWFEVNDQKSLNEQINRLDKMGLAEIKTIQQELREYYISNYSFEKISKKYLEVTDLYA